MKKNGQKSNDIYFKLKEDILLLKLEPGTVLSEIESASNFNISRTPVRDAFKRLEFDGLLEVKPHIGSYVTLIDIEDIEDAMYIREKVEVSCMLDLMNTITQMEKIKIDFILDKQEKLINSNLEGKVLANEFILSDNEFHRAIFEFSNRVKAWEYINELEYDYQRFRLFLNIDEKDVLKKLYTEHRQLFELILNKDEKQLVEAFHRHLNKGFEEGLKKVFKSPHLFKNLNYFTHNSR